MLATADRSDATGREVAPSWTYSFTDLPLVQVEALQNSAPTGESTTRRRRRTQEDPAREAVEDDSAASSFTNNDDVEEAATVGPLVPRPAPRPSPLAQFSALPPPSLRAAATGFTRATDAAVRVVDAEARVRDCARRVKRARRDVDRRVKEEAV